MRRKRQAFLGNNSLKMRMREKCNCPNRHTYGKVKTKKSELSRLAFKDILRNKKLIYRLMQAGLTRFKFSIYPFCIFRFSFKFYNPLKSNDSKNLVVKIPDLKPGSSISRMWNGMVVLIPSITTSCKARFMRVITSSRD